jgi:tRNA (guanine-N7-)-methyltransferase
MSVTPPLKRILSFARRIGRPLCAEVRAILKEYSAEYLLNDTTVQQEPASWFAQSKSAYYLEIGFGYGEHFLALAAANPHAGIVGCEPFMNGVGHVMREAVRHNQHNIRMWAEDVWLLLPHVPDGFFQRVYILYPDPWPKRGHHKRRIVSAASLAKLHPKMAAGGELLIASDHADYLEWIEDVLATTSLFQPGDEAANPFLVNTITRYQAKALEQGVASRQFYYVKRG